MVKFQKKWVSAIPPDICYSEILHVHPKFWCFKNHSFGASEKSLADWTVESQWVFVLKHHMFLVFKFKPLNLRYIGDLGASQSPGLDCACPSCHLDRAGGWVLLIQNWALIHIHIWRVPKIGVPPNHPFIDVFSCTTSGTTGFKECRPCVFFPLRGWKTFWNGMGESQGLCVGPGG